MASSLLRNDQQVKQPAVQKTPDSSGGGKVTNSQLGSGSGKVINGCVKSKSAKK